MLLGPHKTSDNKQQDVGSLSWNAMSHPLTRICPCTHKKRLPALLPHISLAHHTSPPPQKVTYLRILGSVVMTKPFRCFHEAAWYGLAYNVAQHATADIFLIRCLIFHKLHQMKAADSVMAGKASDGSIKWQLCYDMSARTWWMVSWQWLGFFFVKMILLTPLSLKLVSEQSKSNQSNSRSAQFLDNFELLFCNTFPKPLAQPVHAIALFSLVQRHRLFSVFYFLKWQTRLNLFWKRL